MRGGIDMLNYLMQILKELQEINKKLDKLENKNEKINIVTGNGRCRAVRPIKINGARL